MIKKSLNLVDSSKPHPNRSRHDRAMTARAIIKRLLPALYGPWYNIY